MAKLSSLYFLNDTTNEEKLYKTSDVFDEHMKQKPKEFFKDDHFLQFISIELISNAESKLPELKIVVDRESPLQFIQYKIPPQNKPDEFEIEIMVANKNDPYYPDLKPITAEDTAPEKLVGIINKLQDTITVLCNRILYLEDYIDAQNNYDEGDGGEGEDYEYSTWSPSSSSNTFRPNNNQQNNEAADNSTWRPQQPILTNPAPSTNPFAIFSSAPSQNSNTNTKNSYFPNQGNNNMNTHTQPQGMPHTYIPPGARGGYGHKGK